MNCEQACELVALAASNDVTPVERNALALHTAECSECRTEAAAFGALRDQLGTLREGFVPEYVYTKMRAQVIGELNESQRHGWFAVWPAFAAMIVCSLVLVVIFHPDAAVFTPNVAEATVVTGEVAAVQEPAPAISPASPHRVKRTVGRTRKQESAEPLVVQMFTSDPDVVMYWIADARGKRPEREIIQ